MFAPLQSLRPLSRPLFVAAAGGGGFDPTAYGAVGLRLRAGALSLSDGTTVTSWPDTGGAGKNGTASGDVIYKTGGSNGKSYVRFNSVASTGYVTGSNVATTLPFYLFAAAKYRGGGGNIGVLFEQYGGADNVTAYAVSTGGAHTWRLYNGINLDLSGSPSLDGTGPYLFEALSRNSGSSFLTLNGGTGTTGNAGTITPSGPYWIAKWEGGGQYHPWDIYELIGFTTEPTGTALAAVREYFRSEYAIY